MKKALRWFTRSGPPHLLAILRIAYGLYLLLYFIVSLPHVSMLYSNAGLVIPYDLSLFFPDFPTLTSFINSLIVPPSPEIAWILYGILIATLVFFTIGMATRTSATIAFLLYLYYTLLSFHHYSTSYNRLFLFLLFLFTFSGAGKTFSFEMRRKYGSWKAWQPISVFTQRIIAIQIFATYAGVTWQKIWLPAWQGGEILYYSFQGMWATPLAFFVARLPIPMIVYDGLVFFVKILEVAFPIGFWIKKLRPLAIAAGIFFHVSVTIFLAAIWWFYAMIACYICYFEPEEVFSFLKRKFPNLIQNSPS